MSQDQWNEEDYRQEIIFGGLIGDACGTRNEFQSGQYQDLSVYDNEENVIKEAFHEGIYTEHKSGSPFKNTDCLSTNINAHNKGYLTSSDDSTFMLAMVDMMNSDEYKRIYKLRQYEEKLMGDGYPESLEIEGYDAFNTDYTGNYWFDETQASPHIQMRRLVYKYMAKWYKKNKYPLGQYGGTTLGILGCNADVIANWDEQTIKSPFPLKLGQQNPYDEDKKTQDLEDYLERGYKQGMDCSATNGAIMKAGAIAAFSHSLREARFVARASAMSSHNEPENAFYTDMYVSACWFAKEYKMNYQGQNIDPQEVKKYVFDNLKTIFFDNFDKNFNSFVNDKDIKKYPHIKRVKENTKLFLTEFFSSLQDAMDPSKTSFKACFPKYDKKGVMCDRLDLIHEKPNKPQYSLFITGDRSNGVKYARTPHTFIQAMYSVFSASNFLEAGRNAMADGTDVDTEGIVAQSLSAGIFGLPPKIKEEMQKRLADDKYKKNISASTSQNGLNQNSIGGGEILRLAKGKNVDIEQQNQKQQQNQMNTEQPEQPYNTNKNENKKEEKKEENEANLNQNQQVEQLNNENNNEEIKQEEKKDNLNNETQIEDIKKKEEQKDIINNENKAEEQKQLYNIDNNGDENEQEEQKIDENENKKEDKKEDKKEENETNLNQNQQVNQLNNENNNEEIKQEEKKDNLDNENPIDDITKEENKDTVNHENQTMNIGQEKTTNTANNENHQQEEQEQKLLQDSYKTNDTQATQDTNHTQPINGEDKNKEEHKTDNKATEPKPLNTTASVNSEMANAKTKNNYNNTINNAPENKQNKKNDNKKLKTNEIFNNFKKNDLAKSKNNESKDDQKGKNNEILDDKIEIHDEPKSKPEKEDDNKKIKTNNAFNNFGNIGQNIIFDAQKLKKGQLKEIKNKPNIQGQKTKEKKKSIFNNLNKKETKNNNTEKNGKKVEGKLPAKPVIIDKINPLKVKKTSPQQKIDKKNDKKKEDVKKTSKISLKIENKKNNQLLSNVISEDTQADAMQTQGEKPNKVPFETEFANLCSSEQILKQKVEQAKQEYEEHKKTERPHMTVCKTILSAIFIVPLIYYFCKTNNEQKAYDKKMKSLEEEVKYATDIFNKKHNKKEQLKQEYVQQIDKDLKSKSVNKKVPNKDLTSANKGKEQNFKER